MQPLHAFGHLAVWYNNIHTTIHTVGYKEQKVKESKHREVSKLFFLNDVIPSSTPSARAPFQ